MKKFKLLATIGLLTLLSSCANTISLDSENVILEEERQNQLNEVLKQDLASNEVLLNLTRNGLYNGSKGLSSSKYMLDNYVIVTLSNGQDLPTKSSITSTVSKVEFSSWVHAIGGELKYVSKVQEGVKYYQVHWEYNENGQITSENSTISSEDVTTSNTTSDSTTVSNTSEDITSSNDPISTSSDETPITRRITFFDNNDWSLGGTYSTAAYIWNSTSEETLASWPGVAMTWVDYGESEESKNKYCIDIEINKYDKIIFVQVSGEPLVNNEQTMDLDLPAGNEDATCYLWDSWNKVDGKWKASF